MTLPTVIRIFFAIDPPASIKEQIGDYISQLKKKSRSHAIRWTRSENLHITLQFLAEVKTEHVDKMLKQVRSEIEESLGSLTIQIEKVHLFPTPFRPRVIVLDVSPQETLADLSALIGKGIMACDYEIESRPFRAHLTIGRIKHPQGVQLAFLQDVPIPAIRTIPVEEVVLYRSEPQPEGSKYSVIDRVPLKRWEAAGS